MHGLYIGIALMVVGIVLIFCGRKGSKNTSVTASGGSVAVGGSNRGRISNVNVSSQQTQHEGGHAVNVIGIVVEIIGIAVVIWHAIHLASTR